MGDGSVGGQNLDRGIRLVLQELRDLRVEMRADRQQAAADRQQAAADRRRADAERRRADAERRRADAERRRADEERRQEMRRSDERFQQLIREFREDSARREAARQRAFKDIRTAGLSIVKTLNHHTRLLQRIDRKLGGRGPWRPGSGNGPGTNRS